MVFRRALAVLSVPVILLAGAAGALLGTCGPFTDAAADAFCPFVLEIFYLGITTGTTPATYDPSANVSRLQMAAFLSRTVDGVLKRGGRRAILDQFWTTQNATVLGVTTVGSFPEQVKADGKDVWVSNGGDNTVSRVRASDGKLLESWTGADTPGALLSAMGRIFVTGSGTPGKLFRIDPSQPAGAVTTVASNLGVDAYGIAFDGSRIFTGNIGEPGSVSIVTPGATIPWTVTTVTAGFSSVFGVLYDGANVWAADTDFLFKLDSAAGILQTVTVGAAPGFPVFDGANIWVPNRNSNSVTVVRASTGAVLSTLTGNGLGTPMAAAFDGQRVLVTNNSGKSVSLWKAGDLTALASVGLGGATEPGGACSDGIHFWVALGPTNQIARF
jgi:hypothetical protein